MAAIERDDPMIFNRESHLQWTAPADDVNVLDTTFLSKAKAREVVRFSEFVHRRQEDARHVEGDIAHADDGGVLVVEIGFKFGVFRQAETPSGHDIFPGFSGNPEFSILGGSV